jgi:hypothetical protein
MTAHVPPSGDGDQDIHHGRLRPDPLPLPTKLIALLNNAHAAELAAVGHERIPAFRTMRALLGGARSAGYTAAQLAACLGVRTETLRARAGMDDWIRDETFADLAALQASTIRRWQRRGLLVRTQLDDEGRQRHHLASELIRALIRNNSTPSSA